MYTSVQSQYDFYQTFIPLKFFSISLGPLALETLALGPSSPWRIANESFMGVTFPG
jgi:hypothetical protein